jgi:hypothetical protein
MPNIGRNLFGRLVRPLRRRFRLREFCALIAVTVFLMLFVSTRQQDDSSGPPVFQPRVARFIPEPTDAATLDRLQPFVQQSSPLSPLLETMDAVELTADTRATSAVDLTTCAGDNGKPWKSTAERPPENINETFVWQKVSPPSDVMVFSAFLDRRWRPVPIVLIIGLSAEYTGGQHRWFCRIWYLGSDEPEVMPSATRYVAESHGRRYAVSFDVCSIRNDTSIPYAVSLISDPCDQSTHNLLKVLSSPPLTNVDQHPPKVNYTVCVTPFNFNYNNYHQLTEMIEVSRLFGAQHFIFYNYSTGVHVKSYLDSYVRQRLVTVVQWPLPVNVEVWPPDRHITPDVHYFAQLAALNDCLYRSLQRSSTFVVYEDLDEILVPRLDSTWTAMLNTASSSWTPNRSRTRSFLGAYLVRNTFFRTDWPSDEGVPKSAIDHHVLTLLKTQREAKIFEYGQRSKFVAWTKAVIMVGVHQPLEMMPWASTAYVDEKTALLHHYRLWIDDPNHPPAIVVDQHMRRFTDEILRLIVAVHRIVSNQLEDEQRQRHV